MELKTKFNLHRMVYVKKSDVFYLDGNEKDKPYKMQITGILYHSGIIIYELNNRELFTEYQIYETKEECEKAIKGATK